MKTRTRIMHYIIVIVAVIIAVVLYGYLVSSKKQPNYNSRTSITGFQVLKNGQWVDFYVKGVNIGTALPGKWFSEFSEDKEVYRDWLNKIGEMNANCIRVYTLLPPQFYEALNDYNHENPDQTLWLLQEIWPDENPTDMNYLDGTYVDNYKQEIRYVIDAVHGNAEINTRLGRAFGTYKEDVSKYVLGYLIGRELEPDEVIATNKLHPGYLFTGQYFSSGKQASPTEGWLAMNCDYLLSYEESHYDNEHPVSIVSWPTLDPKNHDSEWNTEGLKSLEYDDKVAIDINHIDTESDLKAGFFGSYHIYPNYPDFINNETAYESYRDESGIFRYGAYLKEFMQNHTRYPALVAEFGVPTGMANAHTSPDGLNHGGLTEEQQGNDIVRMMKAIKKEGYAGGLIFEWMDEWAKKTWITEPYMIPYERHIYWHNAIDPEQNYGLLAMESVEPMQEEYLQKGNGIIQSIGMKHDCSYLYLTISFSKEPDFSKEQILVGLDTYDRNRGEHLYSPKLDLQASSGMEFLIKIDQSRSATLLVQPNYNVINGKYSSVDSSLGIFEEMKMMINRERITKAGDKITAIYADCSSLSYGKFKNNSYYEWYHEDNALYFRIPWSRLNFSDPSSMTVIDDQNTVGPVSRDQLATTTSDGILISTVLLDKNKNKALAVLNAKEPFTWQLWNKTDYKERLKTSYYIIQDYFADLE